MLVHLTSSPQFHSWWERHICAFNAAPHSVHPDRKHKKLQVNFKLFFEPNDELCLKDVSARCTFKVNKNCWLHFIWMQLCSGAFLLSIVHLCLQLAGNEKINQVKCGTNGAKWIHLFTLLSTLSPPDVISFFLSKLVIIKCILNSFCRNGSSTFCLETGKNTSKIEKCWNGAFF